MVVVEIDEAFAVDSVTSSENGKKHKYVTTVIYARRIFMYSYSIRR